MNNINIADGIKNKREEYRLEQQELAHRAGVSKSLISLAESGHRIPSLLSTVAIADALHCTVDELLGRKIS